MTVHTLRVLRWVYLGRLMLAAGIFGGALPVWLGTSPETTLLATLGLLSALAVTLASVWYTNVLGRAPGHNFNYVQVLFDTMLVTLVVHITWEGSGSPFAPLYIPVIAAGALLLPLPGGMLIGALASLLYFADMMWWQPAEPTVVMLLQIGLFVVVAAVTATLGERVRRAGTALGAMESELRQLRLDTTELFATIDTGLITVDGSGRLVYMNGSAESLLAMDERQWRNGAVLEELDRRAPGLGQVFARTVATRTPVRRFEIRMPAAGGDRFLGLRTTLLERGPVPWVTAALQDITEAKRVEGLVRRAERLQAVAELGASLAHEIKNPLASIRSAVEQLSGTRLRPQDRERLHHLVITESDRLSRLLTDFMEFSRVELRKQVALDVRKVTREAIGLVKEHPAAGTGVSIDFRTDGVPLHVEGDQDLLHRAVFNLVLNAVQHAGPGGNVTVTLDRATELERGMVPVASPVRLTVTDSGPGVAEADIPRLFDPFFTRRDGGTGLGLAMVHRAIEAHKGAILVDAVPGGGARFTVFLPSPAGSA